MNTPSYIAFNLIGLVVGQWLVTKSHWSGFLVWCACNVYGVIACLTTGIPETSCLFAAYFIVNFCSLWSWLGKNRVGGTEPKTGGPRGPQTLSASNAADF
jgi:nicotinamide riboside transporter PnuC